MTSSAKNSRAEQAAAAQRILDLENALNSAQAEEAKRVDARRAAASDRLAQRQAEQARARPTDHPATCLGGNGSSPWTQRSVSRLPLPPCVYRRLRAGWR